MKNIFLIDGASGTGKSDLLEYVKTSQYNCGTLQKTTTRDKRDYEKNGQLESDLRFYSKDEFDHLGLDYTYKYRDFDYGFSKFQLNQLLLKYQNIFIIIRSVRVMKEIIKDYGLKFNIVTAYIHSDLSKIKKRLRIQNFNETEIQFRISRIEKTYEDYVLHSSFFNEVLLNNSDRSTYHELVNNLVQKYNSIKSNKKILLFSNTNEITSFHKRLNYFVQNSLLKISIEKIKVFEKSPSAILKSIKWMDPTWVIIDHFEMIKELFFVIGYLAGTSKELKILCLSTEIKSGSFENYPEFKSGSSDYILEELRSQLSLQN